MADDFRFQVKQIISDFKAAERITGDISVGIVAVAVALWAAFPEESLSPAAARCLQSQPVMLPVHPWMV